MLWAVTMAAQAAAGLPAIGHNRCALRLPAGAMTRPRAAISSFAAGGTMNDFG